MRAKPFLCAIFACVAFLFIGCGVDNFVYLYPVKQILHSPSADDFNNYYEFRTTDDDNASNASDYFRGFEIYYRIYNSDTIRAQDVSDISTWNTNNPTTVFNYISTTKKYVRMNAAGRIGSYPLIFGTSTDRDVKIRLIDYGIESAAINVGGTGLGTPLRTKNEGTQTDSFTFGEIASTDSDVTYSTSGETTKFYVQAYVFAYGYDTVYKPIYSSAFGLGTITITN